jgi:hypothetical protein
MSSPEAPAVQSPSGAVATARRESQKAAYEQLQATLKELDRLDVPVLDDSHLQALGIRKLPDIDVDGHAPFDPEPLFFRPYPLDDGEDLPSLVNGAHSLWQLDGALWHWEKPCQRSYCPGEHIDQDLHCSCRRYSWMDAMAGQYDHGILAKTKWQILA